MSYIAGEVTAAHHGLTIFTEKSDWLIFARMNSREMADALLYLGRLVDYTRYAQNPQPKRTGRKKIPRGNHVSTAKILDKKHSKSPSP